MKTIALALLLLPAPAAAQMWAQTFSEEIDALMARSPTFAAEVAPVLPDLTINVAETLPGDLLAILVPDSRGGVLYFDMKKLEEIRPSPAELDVILIHELYGHVVPQLRDGKKCEDPAPGQRYLTSCVGKREAVILRELGSRPRTTYSLRGR